MSEERRGAIEYDALDDHIIRLTEVIGEDRKNE